MRMNDWSYSLTVFLSYLISLSHPKQKYVYYNIFPKQKYSNNAVWELGIYIIEQPTGLSKHSKVII